MELTEIMREAQQAIGGDYEQLAMCNDQNRECGRCGAVFVLVR